MSSGGYQVSMSIFHVDHAISRNAEIIQRCAVQHLSGHGLDRIPPELRDFHGCTFGGYAVLRF
jgi:hypothetical protein